MKFNEVFKAHKFALIFQGVSFLLGLVAFLYTANVLNLMKLVPEQYTPSFIFIIVTLLLQVGYVVMLIKNIKFAEYLKLLIVIFGALGLSYFVTGSMLSIIDKIYNIVMWGDITQFPAIMVFGAFLLVAEGLNIATCFLKNE